MPDAVARDNNLATTFYAGLPSLVGFPPLPGTDFDQIITYGDPFGSKSTPGAVRCCCPHSCRWARWP